VKTAIYETDLSDAQWAVLKPILPSPKKTGRPPTDRRKMINAILYLTKGGIPWRLLPLEFPPWKTVYHLFRKWVCDRTWESINSCLRALVRGQVGRRSRPTAAILDSQSVKSDAHSGMVGYDAAKRIKGRKRHILVDTLGLLLGIRVTPASTTEREGGYGLLEGILGWCSWLRRIWMDGGYEGEAFAARLKCLRPRLEVQIVKRPNVSAGFQPLSRRWVVERTFAWFMSHRRLVRDYETCASSAEAFAYIAMIRIQLRRLA